MPLPWKKAKVGQVSYFLDDHQSLKQERSLKTGFPTSIVDVFAKNRDRLKKPSKKKKHLGISNHIEEIQNVEPDFDLVHGERKSMALEFDQMGKIPLKDEDIIEVRDLKSQRTNSTKIKAKKLKKFITKKICALKRKINGKKEIDSSNLVCNLIRHEKKSNMDEQEQKKEDEQGEQGDEKETEEEQLTNDEVHSCDDVSNVELDAIGVEENSGVKSQGEGHIGFFVLFMVILFGLEGGRLIAVLLTIMWCLLVKFIETTMNFGSPGGRSTFQV
uniref:Uncharacterized protein n=1 Tax=Nelumbo nucifera TaxID=4432 RepID=A0A822Y282_NELNU|nr:TPA_asm: hypothetical protein HUJ06_028198 [Nelumbo nucifera]